MSLLIQKKQSTICSPIFLSGKNLHIGKLSKVTISPAPANTGFVFYDKECSLDGHFSNVNHMPLCTSIQKGKSYIRTIEHLLAALYCAEIDNAYIFVENNEIPIFDGSCLTFYEKIKNAGRQTLDENIKTLKILKQVEYRVGNRFVKFSPNKCFSINLNIKPKCGHQTYNKEITPERLIQECINARTFGPLYKGLLGKILSRFTNIPIAQGSNHKNTILLTKTRSLIKGGLRYKDEHVRHRVMDLVGDIMLCGTNHISGHIETYSTSHKMNIELLKKVFSDDANFEWQ